jgi:DNA-binding NarL/FixJ family response regulator
MTDSSKIKVVICDDHILFREGLKASLSPYDDLEIMGEAGDGTQLMQLLKHMNPDVILLDINMPIMDGIEALPKIKQEYPDKKIIIVSMHNNVSMISKMIALGANSYLTKGDAPETIHAAIKGVYVDDVYFTPLMTKALLKVTQENDALKTMEVRVKAEEPQTKKVEAETKLPDSMAILERIVNKLDELENKPKDTPTIMHWDKPEEEEVKTNYWDILKKGAIAGAVAAGLIVLIWFLSKKMTDTTNVSINKIESPKPEYEYGQANTLPTFKMEGNLFR